MATKNIAGERTVKHKHAFVFNRVLILCLFLTLVIALPLAGCSKKHKSSRDTTPGGGTGTGTGTGPGSTPGDATQNEQDVFAMTNEERANAGLPAYTWCDGLAACAKAHSNDMCDRGFFDHTNPDGEDPSDRGRLGHAGSYTFDTIVSNPYAWLGENIAMGYSTPAQAMNGWMNSSGHRAAILSSSYTHIGVGNCDGCGTHWTQCFGTR
jgi:uncharacterized protein YkwD